MNVTIAICTWNRAELLRRTLDQLCRLRIPEGRSWEVLVLNNNCTDATNDVAASFSSRLPVRIIFEPKPGQAHARNLAVRHARGEFILWTDDDVLVDEGWATAILDAFQTYGGDLVFGRAEPDWPGPAPSWFSRRLEGMFALLDYGPEPFVVSKLDQPFYGLNFAARRDVHLKLGDFRLYGEGLGDDVDMFERAMAAGMRIVYTPAAVVRHIIPPARAKRRFHRGKIWAGTATFYRLLTEKPPRVPWLAGLPRFFYAKAVEDLTAYSQALWQRNGAEAFYRELQLIRFAGLLYRASRRRFRSVPPRGSFRAEASCSRPS